MNNEEQQPTNNENFLNNAPPPPQEEAQELTAEEIEAESQAIIAASTNGLVEFKHNLTLNKDVELVRALIQSRALPKYIRNEAVAFSILIMGRELGFSEMVSFNHLLLVNGKITLSADAMAGLMRSKGKIKIKVLEDGLFMYPNGKKTFSKVHPSMVDENNVPYGEPYDRITTLQVERGDEVQIVQYCITDAWTEGLLNKDNWKRMPRQMMLARAKSKAARMIASDIIMGLYTADEIFDTLSDAEANKFKVKRTEEGTIATINIDS